LKKTSIAELKRNKDLNSEFKFIFDEDTHIAVVNYLYVVPEGVNAGEVVLTFTLTDSKDSNIKTRVITLGENFEIAKAKRKSNIKEI